MRHTHTHTHTHTDRPTGGHTHTHTHACDASSWAHPGVFFYHAGIVRHANVSVVYARVCMCVCRCVSAQRLTRRAVTCACASQMASSCCVRAPCVLTQTRGPLRTSTSTSELLLGTHACSHWARVHTACLLSANLRRSQRAWLHGCTKHVALRLCCPSLCECVCVIWSLLI